MQWKRKWSTHERPTHGAKVGGNRDDFNFKMIFHGWENWGMHDCPLPVIDSFSTILYPLISHFVTSLYHVNVNSTDHPSNKVMHPIYVF